MGGSAFSGCSCLNSVVYIGTEAQWGEISIGRYNDALTDAKRYYVSSEVEIVHITTPDCENGCVFLSNYCPIGTSVTVFPKPTAGYKLNAVYIDGQPIEGSVFVADGDHVVSATFTPAQSSVVDSGNCGGNVTWTLYDDGELYIAGTGAMQDYYNSDDAPWYTNYRNQITSVVIDSGVTSIGDYAFRGCSALTSVVIPRGVTSIGSDAFSGCASLASVNIPKGVTMICTGTFYNCTSLVEVILPNSLTTIEGGGGYARGAFRGCSSLTSIVVPESVTSVGDYAFHSCSSLNVMEFLGDVPSFGSSVFPGQNDHGFIIRYHAGKSGWTSPKWNGYFTDCIGSPITDFSTLDSNNRNSQNILFTLNDVSNTAIVGDNSSTGHNSGYCGNNLGLVVIPATVTQNGKQYNVIGIGQEAFSGNYLLKTIELGDKISSVDTTAFRECPLFTSFTVSNGNIYYKAQDGVLYDKGLNNLYCYPDGKTDTYYAVPETVGVVGPSVFYNNKNLTEIVVHDRVMAIGQDAFGYCENLARITLPFIGTSSGVGTLKSVFIYDPGDYWSPSRIPGKLRSVTITGGKLNSYSFSDLEYIKEVNFSADFMTDLTEIPSNCFSSCTNLATLRFGEQEVQLGHFALPEGIKSISYSAFSGCDSLVSISFPDSLTSIGNNAFYGCDSLASISLPAALTELGSSVFSYCSALTSVSIPRTLTSMGRDVFYPCVALERFAVDERNTAYYADQWGVLYNKDMYELLIYPSGRQWPYYNVSDNTTSISSRAFYSCGYLVNLYIPNSVTTFESNCITSCPGLTVCAYLNSKAYSYASNNSIPVWPMDNFRLQGIEIYSLPEQQAFRMGSEDFSGLYLAANGGKALQADGYTLSYDPNRTGLQTVTVSYQGLRASFPILLYGATDQLLDFGGLNLPDGATAYAAVYHTNGQMTRLEQITVLGGKAQLAVPKSIYATMGEAKLFVLQNGSFVPLQTEVTISR